MSKEEEKYYTPEEAAVKVLEKAQELMRKSELFKNNTSHDVEVGEEPSNDDAECPEYLADADLEDDYKEDEKRKNGKKKSSDEDGVSQQEAAAMEDIAEDEVNEHNDHLHEGQNHEEAEGHEDTYGEDEDDYEDPEEDEDEDPEEIISAAAGEGDKKKKKMDKSENKMKEMSSKEDYDLDKEGEYPHGSLGGEDSDQKDEHSRKKKKKAVKKAMSVDEAIDKILHDKYQVQDILPKVAEKDRDDVLAKLRQMDKEDVKIPHGRDKETKKSEKMKKAIAATEEMKTDLKKPSHKGGKLKKFMLQRQVKKAGGYPTAEAGRREEMQQDREETKEAKDQKVEKMMGVKPKSGVEGKGGY